MRTGQCVITGKSEVGGAIGFILTQTSSPRRKRLPELRSWPRSGAIPVGPTSSSSSLAAVAEEDIRGFLAFGKDPGVRVFAARLTGVEADAADDSALMPVFDRLQVH